MSTADSNNIGIKLQAAGENLNTWGDPNLNNDFIVLSNLVSKWNAVTINGDTTVSETNYATTNATEVAIIKWTAGTVAAAFNYVIPSRAKRLLIWNNTGYAGTVKLSATTGFAIPTGRIALVGTDGSSDVYNMTPNFGGLTSPTSGSTDIPAWSAVETAIATASLPATAGTVLVSGTDGAAGYLRAKVTTQIGSLTTTQVAGLQSLSLGTATSGGVEQLAIIASNGYVGGFLDGGAKSAQFTPVVGYAYDINATTGFTVNIGGMTTPQVGQEFVTNKFNYGAMYFNGTVNGQSNYTYADTERKVWRYTGATWGWN
jgi:hypothetical protein